ncbi:hypothetical protein COLINT_02315 [Collinsella intestinalis DSM 13280]|uniref:DUF1351 domain-containing protein n=1 Tax=Collinsella intestinalis DSM 13280 TaxID=521003 RepID=C4F8E4_9ACTN|nr:DUF1351 domain-containing protein [Collinsella intestinalis]EEP44816.1 hypothetical protein COLINT_02315 [Collinsella intestinalis DSM 13280]
MQAEVIDDERLEVTYVPVPIRANFETLEARVRAMVADYEGATYDLTSEDAIKQAKRDRTYLNGIVREIDERRKAVKREYTKPLSAFEGECKRIIGIAKDASDGIKAQLDAAEDARRKRAYNGLAAYYAQIADLLAPVVPYERIHEDAWLLKSFGEVKAKNALEEKVGKLAADWGTLKAMKPSMPHYETAERELFRTLDLGAAISAAAREDAEDRRIAEMKAAMEQPAPEPEQAPQPVPEQGPGDGPSSTMETLEKEPRYGWTFRLLSATVEEANAVRLFCHENGIGGSLKREGRVS